MAGLGKIRQFLTAYNIKAVKRVERLREATAFCPWLSNAIRNCPLCVTKNCPHHRDYDLG